MSNNVAPVAAYVCLITFHHRSKIVHYLRAFLLAAQTDAETIAAEREHNTELQSNVANNNNRTRFHVALNSQFRRIMSHFLNAMTSADTQRWNSILAAYQRR